MLKFTYTETGLHLEHLAESPEDWMATRAVLSVRTAETLHLEPCSASLLLRADLAALETLRTVTQFEPAGNITFSPSDPEFIEVVLRGTWVNAQPNATEGVFLVNLTEITETLLFELWQCSQVALSSVQFQGLL